MFVKHGVGNIVSVLNEEELTDEQKKAIEDLQKKKDKSSKDKFSSDSQDEGTGR